MFWALFARKTLIYLAQDSLHYESPLPDKMAVRMRKLLKTPSPKPKPKEEGMQMEPPVRRSTRRKRTRY